MNQELSNLVVGLETLLVSRASSCKERLKPEQRRLSIYLNL